MFCRFVKVKTAKRIARTISTLYIVIISSESIFNAREAWDSQYKHQFHPKRNPQNAMLSEMHSQTLIFSTDEDRTDHITRNE